ncbi:hypothetical protein SCUP234_07112 [Seiridium cupressi]
MQYSTILFSLLTLASSALAAPTEEKRFDGGWCGVHAHLSSADSLSVTIKVYDSKQFLVASQEFSGSGTVTGTISAQNGMGSDLSINAATNGDNIVSFEYGSDYWGSGKAKTSNSRCSVGDWDLKSVFTGRETLDLDCGFSC